MSEQYEMVNHPSHYNQYSIESIEIARRVFYADDPEGFKKACEFTAFLYRMRMGIKPENSVEQELAKEKWWLNKSREIEK